MDRKGYLHGYKLVHTISAGGYDWSELRVYRKRGRLFYADSSGCSCTSFEDNVSESDLIELPTLASAQSAVMEYLTANRHHYENRSTAAYFDAIEALRELGLR